MAISSYDSFTKKSLTCAFYFAFFPFSYCTYEILLSALFSIHTIVVSHSCFRYPVSAFLFFIPLILHVSDQIRQRSICLLRILYITFTYLSLRLVLGVVIRWCVSVCELVLQNIFVSTRWYACCCLNHLYVYVVCIPSCVVHRIRLDSQTSADISSMRWSGTVSSTNNLSAGMHVFTAFP